MGFFISAMLYFRGSARERRSRENVHFRGSRNQNMQILINLAVSADAVASVIGQVLAEHLVLLLHQAYGWHQEDHLFRAI